MVYENEFQSKLFSLQKIMLFKSISVTQLHAHIYAEIVSSGEKIQKFITSPKIVLYFVPFQKLSFVEKLEADE